MWCRWNLASFSHSRTPWIFCTIPSHVAGFIQLRFQRKRHIDWLLVFIILWKVQSSYCKMICKMRWRFSISEISFNNASPHVIQKRESRKLHHPKTAIHLQSIFALQFWNLCLQLILSEQRLDSLQSHKYFKLWTCELGSRIDVNIYYTICARFFLLNLAALRTCSTIPVTA